MTVHETAPERTGRGRLLAALAVLVLVLVVAVVLTLALGDGDGDARANGATASTSVPAPASATPTDTVAPTSSAGRPTVTEAPPASAPAIPAVNADGLPVAQPAVALTQPATTGDGVTASLPSIRGITASGTGPGNVAGPALAVTVRIVNDSGSDLSLDDVEVTLTYAVEEVPGSPVADSSAAPLGGTLAPGESAEGVYVFSVPADQRELLTVTVGHRVGEPLLVFAGPAA